MPAAEAPEAAPAEAQGEETSPSEAEQPAPAAEAPEAAPAETPAEDVPAEAEEAAPAAEEPEAAPTEAGAEEAAPAAGDPQAGDAEAQRLQRALEEAEAAEEAAAAGAATAAAEAGADAAAEVTEETVTEETARSSDENFQSSILAREDDGDDDDDDNRDVLVGTVLGALGGFAVSQILNNRQVVATADDRVVVQRDNGEYQILKDDNALLRQPGARVRTETFDDGSTRTTVLREDGSQVVTIRDGELRVVRRTRILPDGREILLIDDLAGTDPVDVATLPRPVEPETGGSDADALRRALEAAQQPGRRYSLAQVREIPRGASAGAGGAARQRHLRHWLGRDQPGPGRGAERARRADRGHASPRTRARCSWSRGTPTRWATRR